MADDLKSWYDKIMPDIKSDNEKINTYINFEYKVFREMEVSELEEVIWEFKKYSLKVEQERNLANSRARWLNSSINESAKPLATNYNSYDKEERYYSAIKETAPLKEKLNKKVDFEAKSDILYGISRKIDNMIDMLEKLYSYRLQERQKEK